MANKNLMNVNQAVQVDDTDMMYAVKSGTTDARVSVNQLKVHVRNGLTKNDVGLSNVDDTSDANKPISTLTQNALNLKQDTLVSGTTIKTINGQSVLGAGNIELGAAIESTYTVATRNGSLANQVHSFGINNQSSFGFDAFALREEAGLTNQTVVRETFDVESSVNYDQTGGLVWNGVVGLDTNSVPLSTLAEGAWAAVALPNYSAYKTIVITPLPVDTTPQFTSNVPPSGYAVSASSVYNNEPIYQPWYAFDKTNSLELSNNAQGYWVSGNNAPMPQWISVTTPSPTLVTGYSIRNRNFGGTDTLSVAAARSWHLQGSNDGITWTTIHSVSDDPTAYGGQTKTFNITNDQPFLRHRLNITQSYRATFVAVSEFTLFSTTPSLLRDGGLYYKIENNQLTVVPEPTSPADFNAGNYGVQYTTSAANLTDFALVTASPTTFNVVTAPYSQIAIQKSLTSLSAYSRINSATVTATQTANGKVRLAVSRDLIDWLAWNGTSWATLGTLTNDTSSAEEVIANGMSPATVGGLTSSQWELLFPSGIPDKIAFAYALDVSNPPTDVALIDTVSLNVNFNSAWLQQTPAQVEIRWYNESVTFKTVTAGNYKLAYQAPAEQP